MKTQTIYISEEEQRRLRELKELRKDRSDSLTVRNLINECYNNIQKYRKD